MYEEFLKDLEEIPEMMFNISLYRNKECQPLEMTDADGNVPPPSDEMLADHELGDGEKEENNIGQDINE